MPEAECRSHASDAVATGVAVRTRRPSYVRARTGLWGYGRFCRWSCAGRPLISAYRALTM